MNRTLQIFSTDESKEYYSEEGCHIIEILNDSSSPTISLARARVEVGQKTRLHALSDTTEIYYLLQGQGKAIIGGQSRDLRIGDCVRIEPDEDQSIQNMGDEDLIFLCICHPRYKEANYHDTES